MLIVLAIYFIQGLSDTDQTIMAKILSRRSAARDAAEKAVSILELNHCGELMTKEIETDASVVHQHGPVPGCVLQLLPLVAAAALTLDEQACHEYYSSKLGRTNTTPNSRRGFATRVLAQMNVQFVTAKDVLKILDTLFNQSGSVWRICEWYAARSEHNIFKTGMCVHNILAGGCVLYEPYIMYVYI